MSEGLNKEELVEAFVEALEKRRGVDAATHHDHHTYVEDLIERSKNRNLMIQKIKTNVIGSIVISFVGGIIWIFTKVGEWYLKHGSGNH